MQTYFVPHRHFVLIFVDVLNNTDVKLYAAGSQSVLRASQGIRGYISVMATMKFYLILLKVISCLNWRFVYFVWPLEKSKDLA